MCVRVRNHFYCIASRGGQTELHHSCKSRKSKRHQKVREWIPKKESV